MSHYHPYEYNPHYQHAPKQGYGYTGLNMYQVYDAAKTGMLIGGTGTAALQIYRYQKQQITWQEAVTETVKGSVQTGLAASAATIAGSIFNQNRALSLTASIAAGTAVMYLLNKAKKEESNDE